MLFLLWLCLFILSGVISPLITSSILGIYRPWEFIFQCPIFSPVHGVLKAGILKWFAIPFSSGPITSRQIDGGTVETVSDFIFLGSKITADGDCSNEIKRHFFLGRKAMTNLDSILKSRDTTLLIKVHLVKAMVFPIVMYGCESWTIKKAEHQRIDAFELRCWRRLVRVPGDQTSPS